MRIVTQKSCNLICSFTDSALTFEAHPHRLRKLSCGPAHQKTYFQFSQQLPEIAPASLRDTHKR